MSRISPVVLIVLDGWGYRPEVQNNAIAQASTPFFDSLWNEFPHAVLDASEESVGLPSGQVGNSEIGHMTIGAGKVIDNELVRITKAFKSGEVEGNVVLNNLFAHVKKNNSVLHAVGLVSSGGVHSHNQHLYDFLRLAKKMEIERIAIHAITDGRDTHPQSAHGYLAELEVVLAEIGIGHIATASGRFYAMDRDNNWDRVEKAEHALFFGKGAIHEGVIPSAAIAKLHAEGVMDEHLEPLVFLDGTGKALTLQDNDAVFYFNFRSDRARQLTQRLTEQQHVKNIFIATMTEYDSSLDVQVVFPPQLPETTLSAQISHAGLKQVHVAETEKYAHATYFLNGGKEEPHTGEEFVLVESRKDVKTHDQAPEMRAKEITDKVIDHLQKGVGFVFINFANADMVGHTANVPAIKKAVEVIDVELKRVVEAVRERGGVVVITADHGNAETNLDEGGAGHTAHTTNLVPVIITKQGLRLHNGTLADIAPTVLKLMDLPQPKEMTGKSLID